MTTTDSIAALSRSTTLPGSPPSSVADIATPQPGAVGGSSPRPSGAPGSVAGAFADILRDAGGGNPVSVSGHALRRIEQRGIAPSADHAERLSKAFDTLAAKGGRQSLVMLDDTAYVVRVPERTVVTAVDSGSQKERVFTQIDSVLIA